MIQVLLRGSWRLRLLTGIGIVLVGAQWWVVPSLPSEFTEKWLWCLDPARGFQFWIRALAPLVIVVFPWGPFFSAVSQAFARSNPTYWLAALVIFSGMGFWFFRVESLALGDAQLIMDHFVSLTTYAAVREPLESVLHTDFSKVLFDTLGMHPRTSFQLLSCLWGIVAIGWAGWGLIHEEVSIARSRFPLPFFLFLVGPVHLFFGYIEWYTQMAVGLIVFEVYAIRHITLGKGLWTALCGLVLACSSHLVSFGFIPAAVLLVLGTVESGRRWKGLLILFGGIAGALGATFVWISRHIDFDHSAKATTRLFATILPLMREDNPENPVGSWHYSWLCTNHIVDLANELVLCALYPLLLLAALVDGKTVRAVREGFHSLRTLASEHSSSELLRPTNVRRNLVGFLLPQWVLGFLFLLIWNPWLGFPGDWDLFSFFTWPVLSTAAIVFIARSEAIDRGMVLAAVAPPAVSVVLAWVIGYSGVVLPNKGELLAWTKGTLPDYHLTEAKESVEKGQWPIALEQAELMMLADPERTAEAVELFGIPTIQKMAEEWPEEEKLTKFAVDCEIVSATPSRQVFVLDAWGRVYLWEGGYYNAWSYEPIPGIPHRKAVDMEIASWREAAVILCSDGSLFEVPVPSYVKAYPLTPGETVRLSPPLDRSPRPAGNFYSDYANSRLHPGATAVDLELDEDHREYLVLDTSGNVISSRSGVDYEIRPKSSFVSVDLETDRTGGSAWIGTYFGHLRTWPGEKPPVPVSMNFNWPAVVDFELPISGDDVYVMETLGGVHTFTRNLEPFIDMHQMRHYSPTGQVEQYYPYATYPLEFFCDLELVPGARAFFRMGWNFRIHYSEQVEKQP